MDSTRILGILLLCFRVSGVFAESFTATEGPYKVVISNVSRCGSAPSWFQWNITTYTQKGHSVLGGTVSHSQIIREIKFRIHMYYLEDRKTKVFDMKNQSCHNTIVALILTTVGVPFNEQTCIINTGSYVIKDLNVDAIIHTVVQSLWYGAAQLRVEIGARNSNLMCLDIYMQIVKAK